PGFPPWPKPPGDGRRYSPCPPRRRCTPCPPSAPLGRPGPAVRLPSSSGTGTGPGPRRRLAAFSCAIFPPQASPGGWIMAVFAGPAEAGWPQAALGQADDPAQPGHGQDLLIGEGLALLYLQVALAVVNGPGKDLESPFHHLGLHGLDGLLG